MFRLDHLQRETLVFRRKYDIITFMVGLAQMVRASDCGPEGRRFDPDIPPHTTAPGICNELGTDTSQGVNGSIPISHPIKTICGYSTVVSMQVFQT